MKALLIGFAAASLHAGLRDEEDKTGKTKAVGTCGLDTHTCADGSVLYRDPEKTCRFGACAAGDAQSSFLQEGSEPTFQWTGVSISDDQNFCARMTPILGDYQDLSVTDCSTLAAGNTCTNHYEHILDGQAGDIKHCRDNSDGSACEAGAIHNCTWSFYMEDLISKHGTSEDNCAAKLLEAKRSLDGLLHSVQDVYNQLMQWNAIVQAENSTIRGLLEDQQNSWDDYVSEQANCDSIYTSSGSDLQAIQNEMTELRAIANPDVRSAVDVRQARGYQSSGTSSESCPADYPYVNTANTAYCCGSMGDAAGTNPAGLSTCTQRNCQDERGNAVPCVNNARSRNGDGQSDGAGMLSPSQTAAAAAAGSLVQKSSKKYDMTETAGDKHSSFIEMSESDMFLPTLSSFVEMDDTQVESACQSFSSLIQRVQQKHGSKIKSISQPANCHEARSQLETMFRDAFKALGQLYNEEIFTTESNRSICLNAATYNYKAGVEGIDGIDDQIQDAAGKIHEAQGEIARLEPMLHDVERAVNRMRNYVETITTECGTESYIGHLYSQISQKIQELQECPGRNDFIIDVPHWRPKRQISTPEQGTPAPTPWYEDPKAADVRSIL